MADDSTVESTTTVETATVETTQDDLGDAGKKALAAERAAKKAAEKQLSDMAKRLQEYEDANKTEQQKLAERAEQAERELQSLRVAAVRSQVALAKGVPADLVEFLTGEDEDTVSAQADRLLSRLGGSAPVPPRPFGDVDQGARTTPLALNGDPLLDGLKQSLGLR